MSARPLRLFVAAYPPPDLASKLLELLVSLNPRNLKLSRPDHIHLTLQFIGDTDPRQFAEVQESVERAASGLPSATVAVTHLISLPERGRARLIAAALDPHPTLLELHRRLALRLAKSAKERSADRFLPHMTLGRYPNTGDRLEVSIPDPPTFEVLQIVLVQSVLRAEGAEHRPVATFPLK